MNKFLSTVASSALFWGAFGSASWAGGLSAAIIEPPMITDVSADICAPSRSFDLRGGTLTSQNVWKEEVESLGEAADKVGLGDAEGGFADLTFDWDRCDSNLMIGAGFAITDMSETGGAEPFTLSIDDEVSFAYLEVTYGQPLNETIRYFGGLRVLNFASESRLLLVELDDADSSVSASFTGIGPIAGVAFETGQRTKGQFGFFGKASAAALFGSQRNEEEGSEFGPTETTEDGTETVLSFDAELGVFYSLTDNATVNLGVSYKRLNGVDFVSDNLDIEDGGSFDTGDREFSGVFLGYSYQF